ncbi:MAG TPA: anthranilate synthase component I family protein [Puia sp.]
MLDWASRFDICCFLDSQSYKGISPSFECLLAVGAVDFIQTEAGDAFQQLKEFAAGRQDWLFGHLGYDLAAETEPSSASHPLKKDPRVLPSLSIAPAQASNPIGFPDLYFFIPEIIIELRQGEIRIGIFHDGEDDDDNKQDKAGMIRQEILQTAAPLSSPQVSPAPPPVFTPRFSREEYLATIGRLQQHILRGDCYEINFCQEFFSCPARIDPWQAWHSLSDASPNPFSAFYRMDQRFLLCASPERYLKKTGNILLSQPIKGTSSRHPDDPAADQASGDGLYHSSKDRSENVMVVDLVRNDLSRICLPDTVRVEELYGIYPFPQVFQMISSIQGELPPDTHWVDALRATFPMGSMTGAPKNKVVELIRRYERSRRGIFSGAVGYVTPEGDFDFNVVIRSILYNAESKYLSYQVGSGITFYSDPGSEYEECQVKAEGIRKALGIK